MARKFCLQSNYELVDICSGWFDGLMYSYADSQLAELESSYTESGRSSPIRIVESEDPQAPKLCSDEAVTQRQGGLKRKGILNNEQRINKLRL